MSLKSVHQPSLGLTYVLFVTFRARYAVNEIVALTANIHLCHIFSLGIVADDCARSVQFGTVSASPGGALVGAPTSIDCLCGDGVQFGPDE